MTTVPLPAPSAYRFDAAARQSVGAREYQEDSHRSLVREDAAHISLVADGMGGHVGGATASRLVCDAVVDALTRTDQDNDKAAKPNQGLQEALHAATIRLADEIRKNPELDGMGSTLIATHITGQHLYWASVGDSLLYLFRGGKLRRLNQDHSMAPMLDELVSRGQLTSFEARHHPQRHALRSALTGYEIDMSDVPAAPVTLLIGDWVVLASDGLDTLSERDLREIMGRFANASAEKMASALIDAVDGQDAPFQDNTTLVAIAVVTEDQGGSEANGSEAAA